MKRVFIYLFVSLLCLSQLDLWAAAPTTQAYNITVANLSTTTMRIGLTRGNGQNRLIVVYEEPGSGTLCTPADGSTYSASADFSAAGSISGACATGKVVYNGTGRTVSVTNLHCGASYTIRVYEYNGSGAGTEYYTATATNNPRYTVTVPGDPSNLHVVSTEIYSTSFNTRWNEPNCYTSSVDGYEIYVSTQANFTPCLDGYGPVETGPGTELLIEDIYPSQNYYWKMRAFKGNRFSNYVTYSGYVTTTPPVPTGLVDVTICSGASTTLAPTGPTPIGTGSGYYEFKFYNASSGGTPLHTGTTYTVTPGSTTTYYVTTYDIAHSPNESWPRVSVTVTVPSAMSLSTSKTDVTCNGGSDGAIDLTVSGGSTPYSYSWSNSATSQDLSGIGAGTYHVTVTDANTCTKTASVAITQPNALQITSSGTSDPLCFGDANGSISVSVSGGSGSYTYTWSGGASGSHPTGLSAGTYGLTVSDGTTCSTVTASYTLINPAALTVTTSKTDVLCNGNSTGAASVSASGGTAPLSYHWSTNASTTSISSLGAGTYGVTVTDAHTCTATASVTITQPATALTSSQTVTDVLCNGASTGEINVGASGGTTPYSYQWSPAGSGSRGTNLPAGNYNITVTDANSCTHTLGATINEPIAIEIVSMNLTGVSCNGGNNGSISLSMNGGTNPLTYAWSGSGSGSNPRTNLAAGTYTVSISDANSCGPVTATATITQPNAIQITGETQTDVACNGNSTGTISLTTTGGTGALTYNWSGSGSGSNPRTNLAAGTYTVSVSDANTCGPVTASYIITQPNAIQITGETQTDVLCNGASTGVISLTTSGGTGTLTYSWSGSSGSGSNPRTNLAAGTYTVSVSDANNCGPVTASYIITQPNVLTASGSVTHQVSCFGGADGAVSLAVGGGTLPYSFTWSPSGSGSNPTTLSAGSYNVTISDANSCGPLTASFEITQPGDLAISTVFQYDNPCFGLSNGSIELVVTGGTTNYTFSWSSSSHGTSSGNPISNLYSDTYTVTISDANSCGPITASYTITEPSELTITGTSKTDLTCNGNQSGSISVSVSGGTTPYSYAWSDDGTASTATRNGLAAGSYTVSVDDNNGCGPVTATIILTQPDAIAITGSSVTDVSCNGGSNGQISISLSGGTTPYTYNWSGGSGNPNTGLTAGSYSVTISDANSCGPVTASFNVTQPDVISISNASITDNLCNGDHNGAIIITATGGTQPYYYSWSGPGVFAGATTNNPSNLGAGSFTVTVNDANSCTAFTATYTVTEPSAITLNATPQNVTCWGGTDGAISLSVTGGITPYSYLWSDLSTESSRTGLSAGTYDVSVSDANTCGPVTASYIITQPNAIQITGETQTDVVCNGASTGVISLTTSGGTGTLTYTWSGSSGSGSNPRTNLAAGTYTVSVSDANNCGPVTASYIITQPNAIQITGSSKTDISCNGAINGAISVTVSGGTSPLTYNWSNETTGTSMISGLSPQSYTVTISDANSCGPVTATWTLTEPPAISITASGKTDITCNGDANGQIIVSASGGTGTLTYNWSDIGPGTNTRTGLSPNTYTVSISDANTCGPVTASWTITQPGVLSASPSTTDVLCNGGNNGIISLNVTGGTSPYSYTWSTGGTGSNPRTGLTAGNYSVTVTDVHQCVATTNATIVEPTALTATMSSGNVSCFGGSDGHAEVSVSGGTLSYSYIWSNNGTGTSITGLSIGTYSVTVTDGNTCSITNSVTIIEPELLSLTLTGQTDVSCAGLSTGSATVSASGGTSPYSYSWSTSPTQSGSTATGLGAGSYTVSVTDDNGCTASTNVTITQPSAISITSSSQTDIRCNGMQSGAISVTATGGTGTLTYTWSPGGTGSYLTGLQPTTYTVSISDANGCGPVTASWTITEPSTLGITASVTQHVSCNAGNNGSTSVSVNGGTSTYTFAWSGGGGNASEATGLTAGTYTVTVTDAHSCYQTASVEVTEPSALSANAGVVQHVNCNGTSTGSAQVSTQGGTPPYSYSWTGGSTSSTAGTLAAGTYFVTVTDAHSCTATSSAIITQPTAISITNVSSQNVSCNGGSDGSITVTATGGTGTLTYSWSPSGSGSNPTGLTANTYTVSVSDANSCGPVTASVIITQPTALSISASSTNENCFGASTGVISLNVSGGTAPYSYIWSGSGTGTNPRTALAAGVYYVTVTDNNGCTISTNVTIFSPSAIIIDTQGSTITDVLCNGSSTGVINVAASGGTGTLTYSWSGPGGSGSNPRTSLGAGTYTVSVSDANSCGPVTASFVVTQPSGLTATASVTQNVLCNAGSDGSASVSVSGGVTPYSYSWSGGGTSSTKGSLTAGTYDVTVTDAHTCIVVSNVITVTQPTALTATASVVQNVRCNGGQEGSASVSVSGGTSPYTYLWTGGGTNSTKSGLIAGTYQVTVTDANTCSIASNVITVTEPTALTATASVNQNVLCNGSNSGTASVSASGGTGPYTYLWSNAQTTSSISSLVAGTYKVTVTDAHTCTLASNVITVTEPSAITATGNVIQNVSCNGGNNGSASVSASGGTGPYSYLWTGGGTASTKGSLTAGTYTVTVTDANTCTATASVTITQPPAISITSETQTDVSCNAGNNGAIIVNASGGTGTLTYTWSPSGSGSHLTGLTAGIYNVSVSDANTCTPATASYTITQPSVITISSAKTDVSCNGLADGAINLTVTGGTSGYTYTWSPPIGSYTGNTPNQLSANTYNVTVTDAHQCTQTASVIITEPPLLAISSSTQTDVLCFGSSTGVISLTISGGTTAYSYSWSTGGLGSNPRTGLGAGTYNVTVTDAHNCSVTSSYTITQPSEALGVTSSKTDVSCNGGTNGSISLSVTGGTSPYTYSWSGAGLGSNPRTGLSANTFNVTVTDAHSCTITTSVIITQPNVIAISGTSKTDNTCFDGTDGQISVSVTGGTTPYSYTWSGTGSGDNPRTGLANGSYTVTVSDVNSCTAVTASVSITSSSPSALTISTATTDIECYGGTTGRFIVTITGGSANYSYTWSAGGTNSGTGSTASAFSATNRPAGTYTMTITDASSCVKTASFEITQPFGSTDPLLMSNLTFTNIRAGWFDASWTKNTSGYGSFIIMRHANDFSTYTCKFPVDGGTYSSYNSAFNLAPVISGSNCGGSGERTRIVYYSTTGTSVHITGTSGLNLYYLKALSYTGNPGDGTIDFKDNDSGQPIYCTYNNNKKSIVTGRSKEATPGENINQETRTYTLSNFSPNPAVNKISFMLDVPSEEVFTIGIVNDIGQRVLTPYLGQVFSEGKHQIDIPFDLPSGTYMLQISGGGETAIMIFLVVK